jgi:prophage antirepressor-like protein
MTQTNTLSLIKSENFGEVKADFYKRGEQDNILMTVEQLAECLGYANERKGIDNLLSRNGYLKSNEFSVTLKIRGTDGKYYNTRLFTEDGIYEVTFLAKTEKAKQFRTWVRGILKSLRTGELQISNNSITLSTEAYVKALEKYIGDLRTDVNNLSSRVDKKFNDISNSILCVQKTVENEGKAPITVVSDWKIKMYNRLDELLSQQPDKFTDTKNILHLIYKTLNRTYGIVFDQEEKEYKENHNTIVKTPMDLINEKPLLKTLFENILNDMFPDKTRTNADIMRDSIQPLITAYNDNSTGGNATYRKVYSCMSINWKYRITQYKNKYNTKREPNKFKVVEADNKLVKKFCDAVDTIKLTV